MYNTHDKHFTTTMCYSVSKIKSVKIHRIDIVLDCLLNFSLLFIYPTLPNVRQILKWKESAKWSNIQFYNWNIVTVDTVLKSWNISERWFCRNAELKVICLSRLCIKIKYFIRSENIWLSSLLVDTVVEVSLQKKLIENRGSV